MPLTQASLSGKLKTEIENLYGPADNNQRLQDFCDAVAKAVVEEIQTNAVVNTTGTVTSGVGAGGSTVATGTVS